MMPTAKAVESTTIAAQPQKVYDFISEATRATSFIPGLSRIHNVKPAAVQPGQTWEYEFDWFGLVISGNSKCTQSERPKVHQFQTVTGNPSTWSYRIEPDGTNTRLTLEVQYEIPGNVLARFASQPVFEKMNQDRAHEIVTNIKAMLEG
jgi:carbon monoxide dehydrogenase subunit G